MGASFAPQDEFPSRQASAPVRRWVDATDRKPGWGVVVWGYVDSAAVRLVVLKKHTPGGEYMWTNLVTGVPVAVAAWTELEHAPAAPKRAWV